MISEERRMHYLMKKMNDKKSEIQGGPKVALSEEKLNISSTV